MFLTILKITIAVVTALVGLVSWIKPGVVYRFTGITPGEGRGVSEVRAVFGGLFLAVGIAPLFLGAPAYQMLGMGYFAIAAARLFSIFFDRSYNNWNYLNLTLEITSAIILVL